MTVLYVINVIAENMTSYLTFWFLPVLVPPDALIPVARAKYYQIRF